MISFFIYVYLLLSLYDRQLSFFVRSLLLSSHMSLIRNRGPPLKYHQNFGQNQVWPVAVSRPTLRCLSRRIVFVNNQGPIIHCIAGTNPSKIHIPRSFFRKISAESAPDSNKSVKEMEHFPQESRPPDCTATVNFDRK
jgi:hypothetical protein